MIMEQEKIFILMVGLDGVGKSCLVLRFMSGHWIPDVDFMEADSYRKTLNIEGQDVMLDIGDGSSSFLDSMKDRRDLLLVTATHFIVAFSLIDLTSLAYALDYIPMIQEARTAKHVKEAKIVLVGTKADLKDQRAVTKEEGASAARRFGCEYVEVSSKEGLNINELFMMLALMGWKRRVPPYVPKHETMESTMVEDLEMLVNNPALSNLKIVAQNKTVHLHKQVISVRSPAFLQLFDKSNTFNCSTVPYDDLLVLVRCIYTGKLPHPHPDSLNQSINSVKLISTIQNTQDNIPSFKTLLNDTTQSDITLSIKKMNYPAHQQILYCRSIYFKTMITSGMKESHSNNLLVHIKDTKEEIFEQLLRFIYTDQLKVDEKNWQPLFYASLNFGIVSLTNRVERFLVENTTVDNVISIYTLCVEYLHQLPNLMDKVHYVVGYYYPLVVQTKAFKALEEKLQHQLLKMKREGDWKYEEQKMTKKENCILQ